jgi:ubiquinone/menaquinone biosynthesis C-methylase UbiE
VIDRRGFRSQLVPTAHFKERFARENVAFWVPLIVEMARIRDGDRVLDVGCGTGGFAIAIAKAVSAVVAGLDESETFIEFAKRLPKPERGSADWVLGDAERLPFADARFDRVLLSFVLHQLAAPEIAVAEAARVLKPRGTVLIRTIAPEDARARVPARYFPSMAAADEARLPTVAAIEEWIAAAGLVVSEARCVERNARLVLDDEERRVRVEVGSRFTQVSEHELATGLERMRADAATHENDWVDPRPTIFLTASWSQRTETAAAR